VSEDESGWSRAPHPVLEGAAPALDDAEAAPPEGAPGKAALREERDALHARLAELQTRLFAESRRAVLIVLQGRDAAGKDGTVRKVFDGLNPQGVTVTGFRQPTRTELAHDYLWRVHLAAPPRGMIGIFNRSHYEDVLVARVHRLVPEEEWGRRYRQINDFERMLVENGTSVLKFFLHVSRKEQAERLRARLDDPTKNWKFDPGDLAERALWGEYRAAYRDALARCSTESAPWYVVPADSKRVAHVLVLRAVVRTLERLDPRYPPADPEVMRLKGKIE
jgi:PPK2 family polyphosphate:nucleotide phosphotransferase